MRRVISVLIVTCAFGTANSSAQRGSMRGGHQNMGRTAHPFARQGRPVTPIIPGSSLGEGFSTSPRIRGRGRGRGFFGSDYGGLLWPWDYSSYFPTAGYANDYTYEPAAQ